ncbi:MAG: hypothetical protein IKZ25_04065 [Clostridia bacterium]|nr:hypothetical protein [Clostridia bacterium]
MTVKECYDIFLRHIDRATSGGVSLDERKVADFKDKFYYFLNPALEYICSVMKPIKKFTVILDDQKDNIRLPDDFFKIIKIMRGGKEYTDFYTVENVIYPKNNDGLFEIIYSYIPKLPGNIAEKDVIDIPRRCEVLLPLKIASDCVKTEDSALSAYFMNIFNSEIQNLSEEKGFIDYSNKIERLFFVE